MAKKQTPEPLPPPKLVVPRSDAETKITAQIQKGIAIRDTRISSEEDLRKARAEKTKWSQYNIELLTRLFDNPSIAQKYERARPVLFGDDYLGEKIHTFKEDMDYYITKLESISTRLELIPEPITIIPVTLDIPKETNPSSDHSQANTQSFETVKDPRIVFIIHGRNGKARSSLFTFLRSIGLSPLEWSQAIKATGKASPFIGEILDVAFSKAQAIVVLMTPDDVAQLREDFRSPNDPPYESQPTGQARPNVLFEAGMAMGRNPDRTIIVELGTLRPFSDIAGRHTVKLSNDSPARQELAQRLATAGCPVNLTGKDWHTEGDFSVESINHQSVHIESTQAERASQVAYQDESKKTEYFNHLTGREKEILRSYIANKTRSLQLRFDEGTVIELINADVLYYASNRAITIWTPNEYYTDVNMNLWAWKYLNQHPELIADDKAVS
jgi:predicted nucleotide-binding protein